MNKKEIWHAIELELRKAKKKHPNWPDHPAAQAAMVSLPVGYLLSASMEWKYNRSESDLVREAQRERMIAAALQTIANSIRFLENIS